MKGGRGTFTKIYSGKMMEDGVHARFAFIPQMEPMRHDEVRVALPEHLQANRSIHHKAVVDSATAKNVLVNCRSNPKIGRMVMKGPWRGVAMYQLTLEERRTCPSTCHLLAECYGNGLPLAKRHTHGLELERRLARDVAALLGKHPGGIAVRLHILGDFYSVDYALKWLTLLERYERLHLWGYTAHGLDTPVGVVIDRMREKHPTRVGIRHSVPRAPAGGHDWRATTIWSHQLPSAESILCPAETGKTACCSTCALCWSPAAASKAIVFMGHGAKVKRR